MKIKILPLFIVLFHYNVSAQDFWEYIGLEGFFIANVSQDNAGRLYATEWQGFGDSVFFSDDFGKTWNSYGEVNDSLYVNVSSILFLDNDYILVSGWGDSESGGIYKSTDGSESWLRKSIGASTTRVLKSSDNLFGSLYDEIFMSTDEGESWIKLGSSPDPGNEIVDIARSEDGKLFAATSLEVFRSIDNGLSWELVNNGIPPTTNFFMNLTLSEAGYLYLGTRRLGIYRTSDWGENWEHIRDGWIRYVTTKPGGYVMAGAEQEGLILSTDHGDTWQTINSGLPGKLPNTSFINSVYFDKDGYAYCSVHNYGIYRSTLPVSVNNVEDNSDLNSYILYQNYPNPFNSQTIIEFEVSDRSFVTLRIFDLQGTEVQILVKKEIEPGRYSVEFNPNDLSSGVYYYTLQLVRSNDKVNNFIRTNKMILIK